MWQQYGYYWVRFGLILLPAIGMLLIIISNGVNVPYYDEFSNPFRVLILDYTDQLTSAELTRQFNDSRKLISNAIFIVFLRIFGYWNIKFQLYFTWLLGVIIVILLSVLVGRTTQRSHPSYRCLSLLVLVSMSALIFGFTTYYRWLWGITLHRLIPDFCIVLSAVIVTVNWHHITKTLALAGCATIALFSFSGGIVIAPINLALLLTLKHIKKSHIILYLFIIGISFLNFFNDYRMRNSEQVEPLDYAHISKDFAFISEFLGNPFSGRHREAFIVGLSLLLLFIFSLIRGFLLARSRSSMATAAYRRSLIPWAAIGGYAILCAALTAYFRSDSDLVSSLDIRYILHANYLTIAVLGITIVSITHLDDRLPFDRTAIFPKFKNIQRNLILITLLVYFSLGFSFVRYNLKTYPLIHQHKYRLLYGKSCLQLTPYLDDLSCLTTIFPNPSTPQFLEKLTRLRGLSILRPGILQLQSYQHFQLTIAQTPIALGQVDPIQPLAGGKWRVTGAALLPETQKPADAIVVVDPVRSQARQQLTIVAIGRSGLLRKDLPPPFRNRDAGWSVELAMPSDVRVRAASPQENRLQFFAFDANQNCFFRIAADPLPLISPSSSHRP